VNGDPIGIENFLVTESSDMPWSKNDGTVEVAPNEETVLVEYEPVKGETFHLLGLGAKDALDVEYRLRYGGTDIAFTTESALGGINDPFLFADHAGAPLESDQTIQYTAVSSRDTPIDLAGRLLVEV